MPEEIVARILRLPGYGVYAWDADEGANTLTLSIRPTGRAPAYICGGCGISRQEIHSWTERRIRDLPWGTWQVWLRVEVHRVRCRQCGVRTERLPFVGGKALGPISPSRAKQLAVGCDRSAWFPNAFARRRAAGRRKRSD